MQKDLIEFGIKHKTIVKYNEYKAQKISLVYLLNCLSSSVLGFSKQKLLKIYKLQSAQDKIGYRTDVPCFSIIIMQRGRKPYSFCILVQF